MKKSFLLGWALSLVLVLWTTQSQQVAAQEFQCYDANGDENVDVSDIVTLLFWMFTGSPTPEACPTGGGGGCDVSLPVEPGCRNDPNRFLDHGDGTITDTCTGLMWQKVSADVGDDLNGANDGSLGWCDALAFADDLDFGGHTDWRLPNIRELLSIVDHSRTVPAIDPAFVAEPLAYWSSTPVGVDGTIEVPDGEGGTVFVGQARTIDFGNGAIGNIINRLDICGDPIGSCSVFIRAVRGISASTPDTGVTMCHAEDGAAIPCGDTNCPAQDADADFSCPNDEDRFVDNLDGTITDECTGLMWTQNSLDTEGGQGTTNFANQWCEAIEFADGLDFAGHTDWRIPSLHELQSLVDYGLITPSVHPLFNSATIAYWSSTPLDGTGGSSVWAIEFDRGSGGPIVTNGCKECFVAARAVRTAQ